MKPIERLFEREGLPSFGLLPALAVAYGGDFGLARPGLYANFVSSADGLVALSAAGGLSGRVISGASEPDRFVMALLRASADAVLIGAGVFRSVSGNLWHAETVYPEGAQHFIALRRQLGLRTHPLPGRPADGPPGRPSTRVSSVSALRPARAASGPAGAGLAQGVRRVARSGSRFPRPGGRCRELAASIAGLRPLEKLAG